MLTGEESASVTDLDYPDSLSFAEPNVEFQRYVSEAGTWVDYQVDGAGGAVGRLAIQ